MGNRKTAAQFWKGWDTGWARGISFLQHLSSCFFFISLLFWVSSGRKETPPPPAWQTCTCRCQHRWSAPCARGGCVWKGQDDLLPVSGGSLAAGAGLLEHECVDGGTQVDPQSPTFPSPTESHLCLPAGQGCAGVSLRSAKRRGPQTDPAAGRSLLPASLIPAGCFSHPSTFFLTFIFTGELLPVKCAFVEIRAAWQSEHQPETREGNNVTGAKEKAASFPPQSRSRQWRADGPSRGGARGGLELEALSPLSLLCCCLLQRWNRAVRRWTRLPREVVGSPSLEGFKNV